jgi:hypothetical protein
MDGVMRTYVASEMTAEERVERVEKLNKMLAARLDRKGRPLKGFEINVPMIRDELDELEQLK